MNKLPKRNNAINGLNRLVLIFLSIFLLTSPVKSMALESKAKQSNNTATSMVIFRLFSDSEKTIPRSGQPYSLYADGEVLDWGVTDRNGQVILRNRIPKSKQSILMDMLSVGIFHIQISADNRETIEKLAYPDANNVDSNCSNRIGRDLCEDKRFLWLSLIGRDSRFNNEPYLLSDGVQTTEGIVDEYGHLFLDDVPDTSKELTLTFCSGPSIRIAPPSRGESVGSNTKGQKPVKRPQNCSASKLASYTKNNADLNQGMPYVFSGWETGISPPAVEIAVQQEATQKLADYRERAIANDDKLAWLGKLPAEWSEEDFENRQSELIQTINEDVNQLSIDDVKNFQCKKPESVGAVPDMQAVEDFLNAAATDQPPYDDDKIDRLYAAAQKGNWLAIVQVYVYRTQTSSGRFENARTLQLAEWLLARKYGVIYREWGHALESTGFHGGSKPNLNPYDVFAALHNSYPAQYEMGQALSRNEDKALQSIGKAMTDCALNALPAYRKLLPASH